MKVLIPFLSLTVVVVALCLVAPTVSNALPNGAALHQKPAGQIVPLLADAGKAAKSPDTTKYGTVSLKVHFRDGGVARSVATSLFKSGKEMKRGCTTAKGSYSFTSISPGSYDVCAINGTCGPAGYIYTESDQCTTVNVAAGVVINVELQIPRASDHKPSDLTITADDQSQRGEDFYASGKYDDAILAYEEFMKWAPTSDKYPRALLKQAWAFKKLGDIKTGNTILRKLREKYPNSVEAKLARKDVARGETELDHNK